MVPSDIQRAVWASYRRGQCDDKRPSLAWHQAADAAIGHVALDESKSCTKAEARALIAFGYEERLVAAFPEDHKDACRKVIAARKAEMAKK
jgi:hypothetical protein